MPDRARAGARCRALSDLALQSWRRQAAGQLQPEGQWTGNIVLALVDWARTEEGRTLDYYVLGHSAGGAYASRFAGFIANEAKRIVIANAASYARADAKMNAPSGLGGLYPEQTTEAELRRYLAKPGHRVPRTEGPAPLSPGTQSLCGGGGPRQVPKLDLQLAARRGSGRGTQRDEDVCRTRSDSSLAAVN
jgi:hypothetical protein